MSPFPMLSIYLNKTCAVCTNMDRYGMWGYLLQLHFMKIFPARGWHLWYVNPPSSLSSSCAFSSLFTPIALSTVATAPISSNLPRRQKLTFMSVLNLLPSEEKRGKLFWSFWLKGILSQIYDHCSEVFLRLESKICTVQSSQIDKKITQKVETSLHFVPGITWGDRGWCRQSIVLKSE